MEAETPLQAPALALPAQLQQLPALQPSRRASRSICSPPEGPFSYDTPELVWEEGTYASTRFHSVTIPAERINDFVLGENARGQTSFCVFKSERPWKAEQGLPSRTSVLSKVTYWCRAGPEDYSGRTPSGDPKGPGKRRSKIEHGESVKRGCQAHFTIRVLAREPEVAEIRMYQPAHVNTNSENCHNATTQRKGVSHPRGKKAKSGQEGEHSQEGMAVPQVPVLPLPGMPTTPSAEQATRNGSFQNSAVQHYQDALQGAQPPPVEMIQHMANMQALLAGHTSAHLQDPNVSKTFSQGAYMEALAGLPNMSQAEMPHTSCGPAVGLHAELANGSSSGMQLPAVAQLQLPSSQPNQAAAALSQQTLAQAHEALMQHSSLAAAAGNPAAAAAAGGNVELPASSGPSHGFGQLLGSSSGLGQGQILPSAGMQEHPTAKQQMLQAIYDGTAVAQAICNQLPTDNDPRCLAGADVQRKANAEVMRIFSTS